MKAKILLLLALAVIGGSATALAFPPDSTSNVWISFFGDNCTINGVLMPVGTIIDTYSPLGAHCGQQVISSPGHYNFLSVYGKEGYTPTSTQYPVAGDHVTFKVNGMTPYLLGPADDIWTFNGDTKRMALALNDATTFDVAATAPGGKVDSAGITVSYEVSITNDGNGFNVIALSVSSLSGWAVTGNDSIGQNYSAGQTRIDTVTVKIPASAVDGYQDTLTVVAASLFDPNAKVTKKIVTVVDNVTGVDDGGAAVPGLFKLNQNFPNPFNPETAISFSLDKPSDVTLTVYDILGRAVTTLCQGYLPAGQHEYKWSGADANNQVVASGIYFYRLSSDQVSVTRKMALLK